MELQSFSNTILLGAQLCSCVKCMHSNHRHCAMCHSFSQPMSAQWPPQGGILLAKNEGGKGRTERVEEEREINQPLFTHFRPPQTYRHRTTMWPTLKPTDRQKITARSLVMHQYRSIVWRQCRWLHWSIFPNPTIHFWHCQYPWVAHPLIYIPSKNHSQWPLMMFSDDHGNLLKNLVPANFRWHHLPFPTYLTFLNSNPRSFSSKSQRIERSKDINFETFSVRFRPT